MLAEERIKLGRQAAGGDLQSALKLVGLLLRDGAKLGDGFEVWKIRRKADGLFAKTKSYGKGFGKGGTTWSRLSSAILHLKHWWNTRRRPRYYYSAGVEDLSKIYDDCELVRYVTMEVSAEPIKDITAEWKTEYSAD